MSGAKIGLHILPGSGDVSDLIRSAPWRAVKAVDRTDALALARDAGIATRILRLYGIEQLDAPPAVARWLSQDLGATTHLQLVNEHPRGYDQAWQGAVIAGLRAGGYTGTCLVGGFATGTPARIVGTPDGPHFPELEQLYGLLRQPGVALCLNAYAGILPADPRWAQWAPWTCFRHRLIVADLARQGIRCSVVIGESGGDNVAPETQGGGWRTRGWSAAGYLGLLAALDAGDRGDSAVVCRCIFTACPTPDWSGYDIGPVAGQLAAYVRSRAGVPDQTIEFAPGGQKGAPVAALPIPIDNQLSGDGPNRYNECGPACIRMVCDYLGIDPGESIDGIDADETGDPQYVGYTTTTQMVAWFRARGVPAAQSQPQDAAAAIRADLARGWPCIYLGVWDRQALTGGHFEVPIAADDTGITLNNPWGGVSETLSDADIDRYSLGWLVTVQQTKEVPTVPDDPLVAAAKARWEALGVGANPATAIFRAYTRKMAAFLAAGQDGILDPSPCVKGEVTVDGHAYAMFDNGVIAHWRPDTGLVYELEYQERANVLKTCGWA